MNTTFRHPKPSAYTSGAKPAPEPGASTAMILHRSRHASDLACEAACHTWLIYVGDVMIDVITNKDLICRNEALSRYFRFAGAYAVPVED